MDLLTQRLQDTKLLSGVSFAGKGLKLNTAQDAQQIVDAINACDSLEYLNLEGNTIGVEAAEAISGALEKQPKLKHALWKDMFTSRLKEEIPKALKALCNGVMKAKAQLEILDLSDNASGPIGVDGMADFIRSPSCYTLKELRLNNMGLGITGAQMLSKALLDCCKKSEKDGHPLKLKVFVAGRNRLENEGIKALSQVFRKLESLEELSVPQNSIYDSGIQALSEALSYNLSLKRLNLNDNTLGVNGARSLANCLSNAFDLRLLDIGDCLIKTKGAFAIAELLAVTHNIQEVVLSFNSIRLEGALAVLQSLEYKVDLTSLKLDGNKFGEGGKELVRQKAEEITKNKDLLDSMEDDEGSDEDDDDEENDDDDENDDEDEEDYDEEDESESLYFQEIDEEGEEVSAEEEEEENFRNLEFIIDKEKHIKRKSKKPGSASEFISNPTMENLLSLGRGAGGKLITEVKNKTNDVNEQLQELVALIMAVSSLFNAARAESIEKLEVSDDFKFTMECINELYGELFALAVSSSSLTLVNNTLPVFLGLIKGEHKKSKAFNQDSCIAAVKEAMKHDYFPKETSNLIDFILSNKPKKIQKGN